MASKSNGSLLEEIDYLTSLIQSHQASTGPGTSNPRIEKRGYPSKHYYNKRNSFYGHGGHGSRQQPIRQSKAGNMVYRPPSSHLPSLSGHKPQNETSVVFIKKEPGSKRLTYSLPQPYITTTSSHKASQAVTVSHKSPPSTISLHRASASSSLTALSKVTQQGGESASSSRQDAENRINNRQTPHVIIQQESGRPEVMTIPAQFGGHCDSRPSLLDNSLSSSLVKIRKSRRFISKRAGFKKSKMNMPPAYKTGIPRRKLLRWCRKPTSKDNSTRHQQVPPHPVTVGQPTSSLLLTPSTKSSMPAIPTFCSLSSPPLFPVRRVSYKDPPSVSTPIAPLAPLSAPSLCAMPTSPLLPISSRGPATSDPRVVLHGEALTQANMSSKKTRYKWKRRSSSTSLSSSAKKGRRRSKFSAMKLHPVQRYGNKVWVPPLPQLSSNDDNDDDDIFVGEQCPGTSKPPQSVFPAKVEGHTLSRLVGYELKTKRGNKQWVGTSSNFFLPGQQRVKPVRLGSVSRLRSRNRQWVNGQHTLSWIRRSSLSRRSVVGRSLTKWTSSSVVSMDGGRYRLDPTGKKLKRLLSLSSSLINGGLGETVSGYLKTARNSSVKRKMASRVVRKSKVYVWHARMQRKLNNTKYCLFYNRFGKCNKGKNCPYLHDPSRIAVCRKLLKGTCDKMNGDCPLSHEIVKGKMPTCAFFLRGICSRDNCPYLHVSVGRDAKVCPDFLKGFCPREEKCTLQHRHDCPTFTLTGSCPNGSKCPLQHNKRAIRVRKRTSSSPPPGCMEKEPKAFRKLRQRLSAAAASKMGEEGMAEPAVGEETEGVSMAIINDGELNFMPLELNVAPDFIPL